MLVKAVNLVPFGWRSRIRRIPGLAAFQRWLVARFISRRPFVHDIVGGPAAGLRVEVRLPEDKNIWTGTYELDFCGPIAAAVRPGMVCYDIGSYHGFVSGIMAVRGAAEVFAFEPFPENRSCIDRLRQLNPALALRLIPGAVGDEDGTTRLGIMPDASMGKLASSSFQPDAAAQRVIDVPIHRVDTLVEEGKIPPPALMKIDVEGVEADVLRGARRTLERSKPVLFIEAHGARMEADCRAILAPLGYRVRLIQTHPVPPAEQRHLICESA